MPKNMVVHFAEVSPRHYRGVKDGVRYDVVCAESGLWGDVWIAEIRDEARGGGRRRRVLLWPAAVGSVKPLAVSPR